ncbi:MAG: YbaK/EbsC family protein [Rhodospirillales bacterium]
MAITIQNFLQDKGVPFEVVPHPHQVTSSKIADSAHITGEYLAKGVLLYDGEEYILAVVPSTHLIDFEKLEMIFGRRLSMAQEKDIDEIFTDCDRGAVPPVGAAYGMSVMVDSSLTQKPDIYFEGGDHRCLVHVEGGDFSKLMRGAETALFSHHI